MAAPPARKRLRHSPVVGSSLVAVGGMRRAQRTLDQNASNPRADFRRLKDQLAERGLIGEWNNLMWAAHADTL